MANRMTPPAEGQEKDVLLVLDKQQGKVSAVKGIDKEGNLQTVPPTHGGEFMQVDKNSDVFSNFISNFYRKYQDTSGLELFSVKASEAEQDAKAIEDNHRNPTPEGGKRAEMLRVPKPDFHEFKQGYRFDPAKIDWENLKKVGITADTLKNTKDFDRVMRGYKSRNTYTVSGTVGGFYLKPTDVKLSFYQVKDGKGVEFNGHVQPGAQGKSPDKVQPKDVTPCRRESDTGSGQYRGQDQRSHQAGQRAVETGSGQAHRQAEREAGQGAGQEPESGQTQEVQRNENVISTIKK